MNDTLCQRDLTQSPAHKALLASCPMALLYTQLNDWTTTSITPAREVEDFHSSQRCKLSSDNHETEVHKI